MKIKLALTHLNEALNIASTVKPLNGDQHSAYLFTINDGRCFVHSQDGNDYVRAEVPIIEVTGAEEFPAFVYPAERVDALRYLDGWIEIEVGEDAGRYWLSYRTESGAKSNRTTYNPKTFNTLDAVLYEDTVEHIYPTILLKDGLSVTSGYLAKNSSDPDSSLETIQIFDASKPEWAAGDGTMFAADGTRACYFHSPDLAGKGLSIHSKHVSHLSAFLNKCHSRVKVKFGNTMTFVVDQIPDGGDKFRDGTVFGWVQHSKPHSKYKFYPLKFDKVCLTVPKDYILKTLKHIASEMKGLNREKIRVVYNNPDLRFIFSDNKENTESSAVGVRPEPLSEGVPSANEFAANISIHSLIGLFEASRDNNVQLRVAFMDDGKKAFFRTISSVWIGDSGKSYNNAQDAKEPCYECLVTHFSTSMD